MRSGVRLIYVCLFGVGVRPSTIFVCADTVCFFTAHRRHFIIYTGHKRPRPRAHQSERALHKIINPTPSTSDRIGDVVLVVGICMLLLILSPRRVHLPCNPAGSPRSNTSRSSRRRWTAFRPSPCRCTSWARTFRSSPICCSDWTSLHTHTHSKYQSTTHTDNEKEKPTH